jgi:hypothetical protein
MSKTGARRKGGVRKGERGVETLASGEQWQDLGFLNFHPSHLDYLCGVGVGSTRQLLDTAEDEDAHVLKVNPLDGGQVLWFLADNVPDMNTLITCVADVLDYPRHEQVWLCSAETGSLQHFQSPFSADHEAKVQLETNNKISAEMRSKGGGGLDEDEREDIMFDVRSRVDGESTGFGTMQLQKMDIPEVFKTMRTIYVTMSSELSYPVPNLSSRKSSSTTVTLSCTVPKPAQSRRTKLKRWEIRYRKAGADSWTVPTSHDMANIMYPGSIVNTFVIKRLQPETLYEFGVRIVYGVYLVGEMPEMPRWVPTTIMLKAKAGRRARPDERSSSERLRDTAEQQIHEEEDETAPRQKQKKKRTRKRPQQQTETIRLKGAKRRAQPQLASAPLQQEQQEQQRQQRQQDAEVVEGVRGLPWVEGAAVDVRFKGRKDWYAGVVAKVHANGTFDIDYDDGDKEERVDSAMIRPQETHPKKNKRKRKRDEAAEGEAAQHQHQQQRRQQQQQQLSIASPLGRVATVSIGRDVSPRGVASSKDVSKFQVKMWLSNLRLQEYHDAFDEYGIDGMDDLVELEDEDLQGLGITKPFHIKKLKENIALAKVGTNGSAAAAAGQECPLTQRGMNEPVRAADGQVYEKEAIEQWMAQHENSPLTRQPFQHKRLEAVGSA